MIGKQASRVLRFLRTTAIGGIFFLLPLTVVGMLLGQVVSVIWTASGAVSGYLPEETPLGYALLFLSGIAILVLLCFAAGIVASRAVGRKFTATTEKYLLMLFPRYAIFKEQLSGNIGGTEFHNTMNPVLFSCIDYDRIAMEIERKGDRVTLFLPGSPDPWSGTVVVADAAKVKPLSANFGDAMATFEQLGRRTQAIANGDEPEVQGSPLAD